MTVALAFALALAALPAAAQQDDGAPAAPTPPSMPMGLKPPPGGAAGAAANSLKMIDEAIKELNENVQTLSECAASIDYLRKDLAATKTRLTAKGGGKIPSNQAGLIVIKTNRLGRQQQSCLSQSKAIDEHFTVAVRSIAGIQPPSHAGIPPRRNKILQLREKFTASLKKLGGPAGKSEKAAAEPADEGSGQ